MRETAPALLPAQFFSHETALILFGCPMPRAPYAPSLHVSAHRPASQPRRREWVGHRLGALTHSTRLIEGVRVEAPARAWVHAGELWEVDDLVAAADFLLHRRTGLVTIEDLRTAAAGSSGSVRSRLRTAADAARRGSESSEETRLRLAILRAALPEPLLNHELRSPGGTLIARLDLAYPRYRVAVEYDGRVHAEHVAQFRRDADRWDAIRAAGWQHVRILAHHLRPDPGVAVDKVTTALLAGGWTPSRR
ncbi:hypothetical protein QL996_06365 [Planococcus sp. APC 4015]|nr:hypothetical protein [Planococcus sp. APC 4015]